MRLAVLLLLAAGCSPQSPSPDPRGTGECDHGDVELLTNVGDYRVDKDLVYAPREAPSPIVPDTIAIARCITP